MLAEIQIMQEINGDDSVDNIEFELKCGNCGYVPEPDKTKSNDNWDVYSTTCPKCGCRVKISIKE